MKAAAFDYVRPATLREACGYLADGDGEARIIAGGQSLVPLMAMRLVRPRLLVDINDVAELTGIARDGSEVVVGAATRQADAGRSGIVVDDVPLLALALPFVGHDQTRNRGTVGGSLAHADPSAEIGLVAAALGATMTASDGETDRRIDAADFFQAPMTTTLEPGECLTAVRFPVWPGAGRVGAGFQEVSARDSDFAIVAAAAQLALDRDGVCRRAAVAVANAAPTPVRLLRIEEALIGQRPDNENIERLLPLMDEAIEPSTDLHAGADARRHMARSLTLRAILQAAANAAREP
ncbi:MAG: xanthine dehydrogenase family protein subunit M [Alphaproteobacteria bacterium]|nr:xanthine dehydrogenase family protein subunit M [Alphaproteobacteria bacterium]